ncbi:hypothetical protein CORC01_01167 [Colletotrichum orchidophilum]|uniref:Uncharacterized protein n=1 Tax=Colletotrichum orchidophilum TaxID=1209926 RepID=A0A1G4BQ67_9PEZI|nr:uncharacterized protein CORC01_01167 [Colletotrichum orchidophilum]OHF03448.1 hypothetical protein CORC01_01167 [Colletotrichum orchidophilum]
MVFSENQVNRRSEVMVISSNTGPPRLDLALARGRRGTFDSFDSGSERGFHPRMARSSNDLFTQALSRIDTADCDSEWGAVRASARENCDRGGMADLIDFLRTTSPPPEFPAQSLFDDDTTTTATTTAAAEPQEQPEKWGLFKKLRRPRTRARSESPIRRPRTAGLPNSAVASKTSSGNSHIAISIPLEYCHVGPDSDWALAIFNATPPLHPTPPVRNREEETRNGVRPYASERTVTVLKTVSEKGSMSPLNTMSTKRGRKGSVSIWPKINPNPNPMSPPRTPYTTPPGSLSGRSSMSKTRRDRLPPPPPQYAELPAEPVHAAKSSYGSLDKECGFARDKGSIAQNPNTRRPRARTTPRRPENIVLPPRRSSIKIVRPQADAGLDNQRSIDGILGGGGSQRQSVSDGPQLSPGAFSEAHSISPSIATTDFSEPVISSARSAKAYSMASIKQADMPVLPSRQSFPVRPGSSDTTQTTLVGESLASRNPSTRTAASRQSRKERVKSLKQRDMDALRALTREGLQDEDGEVTPRPRTCETVISSLRLPSRDGTFRSKDHFPQTKLSATNLAHMAQSHKKSIAHNTNGTSTKISDWQATQDTETETPGWKTAQEELTPGWETAQETSTIDWEKTPFLGDITADYRASTDTGTGKFGIGDVRDSTLSCEPPRRWGSLHRASWASSVPLLDRIGSFAPSDASVAQMAEMGNSRAPPLPTRMRRPDSGTLSQADADRLFSNRLSFIASDDQVKMDVAEDNQSIAGSIAAFPKPGCGPRLSDIMPVADVVPSLPVDERWSASTLNSPVTVIEVSHPPFATSQPAGQAPTNVSRPHTAGNTNPVLFNTARVDPDSRREMTTADDGDADETATLRPKSRSQEGEDPLGLLTLSARELRNHYANLRSAQVNNLAHEMLRNQERLELRLQQQERNQMLFIERLERCMSDLRSLPGSPLFGPPRGTTLDWPLCGGGVGDGGDGDDYVYEEQHISRDARHEVRVRRTSRIRGNTSGSRSQQQAEESHRSSHGGRRVGDFDDFDGDFVGLTHPRQRRPSTLHDTPRSSNGTGRVVRGSRHQAVMMQPLITRGGLDAMEPLIRELQLASRVSLEAARADSRMETPVAAVDGGGYHYSMI